MFYQEEQCTPTYVYKFMACSMKCSQVVSFLRTLYVFCDQYSCVLLVRTAIINCYHYKEDINNNNLITSKFLMEMMVNYFVSNSLLMEFSTSLLMLVS